MNFIKNYFKKVSWIKNIKLVFQEIMIGAQRGVFSEKKINWIKNWKINVFLAIKFDFIFCENKHETNMEFFYPASFFHFLTIF